MPYTKDLKTTETETLDVLQVVEEELEISKHLVLTGTVKVKTQTETYQDTAEVVLDQVTVQVVHVPMNQIIEASPEVRRENNVTIIPVVEERFVIVKQLYLKEEIHIHHILDQEAVSAPVLLRRQNVIIEHFDEEGRLIPNEAP